MKKYIDSYRSTSTEGPRACHPHLSAFYNSCDYFDQKALKEFLNGNLCPEECSPAERSELLKNILEQLLRAEYFSEVALLEQKLGTDQLALLLNDNAGLKQLYDRYKTRGMEKSKQKDSQQLQTREQPAGLFRKRFIALGFAAFIGIVGILIKLLRKGKPTQPAIKAPEN